MIDTLGFTALLLVLISVIAALIVGAGGWWRL